MRKNIIFLTIFGLLIVIIFYGYGFKHTAIDQKTAIQNIMNYPMAHIIKRCQKDYKYSDQDMIILEKELKRFLALSLIQDDTHAGNGMYSSDVDNLWHTFILFTKEYAHFCNTYFNRFIHHIPELEKASTPEQMEKAYQDFQAFIKKYEQLFEEEIHPIWFLDMCEHAA